MSCKKDVSAKYFIREKIMREIDKKLWNAKTVEEVQNLLKQGADVKAKDKFGLTALCYVQSADVAKVLIDA